MKDLNVSKTYFGISYALQRKITQKSPITCIISILILIIIYKEYQWFSYTGVDKKIGTIDAEKKVFELISVLKRYKVPEQEYSDTNLPKIYIITPTYSRPEQKAELTRLKNVFLHIPFIHWIVIEDSKTPTQLVSIFLRNSKIPFTHLSVETPADWKLKSDEPRWWKPRGILQRNEGIKWLRENFKVTAKGIVYFADDDNTYSIELFKEMRHTERVSVWPVALVGEVMVERPAVDSLGNVVGWLTGWRPDRPFAIDMAGFAVNLGLLISIPNAEFSLDSRRGYMESDFLEKLVTKSQLEPRGNLCTKVLVWHTQTKKTLLREEEKLKKLGRPRTNIRIEV